MNTLVIVFAAVVLAPLVADRLARFVVIPSVVLEILLGLLVGPQVLGWATEGPLITFIADFGLAMLMFLAGYEIDFDRLQGTPLRLAGVGWLCSLVLGLGFGILIHGFTFASLVVGLALTTTALGTILPIVRDRGLLGTRLGPRILAVGGFGEFGPIIAIALLLSGNAPTQTGLLLAAFALVALAAVWLALRPRSKWLVRLVTVTVGTSVQLAIRFAVCTIIVMLWVAYELTLDVLLGAFVAGIVVRLAITTSHPREAEVVQSKLEAIAFGMFVPFFFVVTGMRFDLRALLDNPAALLLVPVFVGLFLVVRGGPILLLHRKDLDRAAARRLALLGSTALPIVVALTTIGTDTGVMRASTAAALVGAAMITVLVFPLLAVRGLSGLRQDFLEGRVTP